jgi:hypothetical protein
VLLGDADAASFDVSFDFHIVILLMDFDVKYRTARRVLGFEADIAVLLNMRELERKAVTRRKYILRAIRKPGDEPGSGCSIGLAR